MAWVRLDDGFLDHPKFLAAGPLAGYLALCAIAWCNRNLTDGFIPSAQVSRLVNFEGFAHHMWQGELVGGGDDAEARDLADELVEAGLWERVEGGFLVHDYHDFQPSAEQIKARRAADLERKKTASTQGKRGRRGIRADSRRNRVGSPPDSSPSQPQPQESQRPSSGAPKVMADQAATGRANLGSLEHRFGERAA